LPESLAGRSFPERGPAKGTTEQIFRTWKTRDGHIVGIAVQDSQFEGLCRAIEREDLLEDPRFSGIAARFQHLGEMYAIVEEEFLKWSSAELVERARRFGAPFGPIHDFDAFLSDPQTLHNETIFEVEDAEGDRTRYLRHAARFSRDAPVFHRPPPTLGEHSEEVLREAGLARAEIAALREASVLG
ncbi:MAG: CoA transferase, partial [Myxococcota bacterium]